MEPIHCAVCGDSPEILKILMAHKDIDVNSLGDSNLLNTPLHLLARGVSGAKGNAATREMLDLLLARGDIDVNKREQETSKTHGMSPLQFAILHSQVFKDRSQLHFVRSLLAHSDIEVDVLSPMQTPGTVVPGLSGIMITALGIAQGGLGAGGVDSIEEGAAIVKELLARGADQHNTVVGEKMGPIPLGLYEACYDGNLEAVTLFLSYDAHVNRHCMEGMGEFPLYAAAFHGHGRVVQTLIETGQINVNLATTSGTTAMHAAATEGFLRCAQQLIVAGGNRLLVDHHGTVPGQAMQIKMMYKPIFDWFASTEGWSPIKVAASCQLHAEAAAALKHGE